MDSIIPIDDQQHDFTRINDKFEAAEPGAGWLNRNPVKPLQAH
jgi:hypothetical protein